MEQVKDLFGEAKDLLKESLPSETNQEEAKRVLKTFTKKEEKLQEQSAYLSGILVFFASMMLLIAFFFLSKSTGMLDLSAAWIKRLTYVNWAFFGFVLFLGFGMIVDNPQETFTKLIDSLEKRMQKRAKQFRKRNETGKHSAETKLEEISKLVIDKLSEKLDKKLSKVQKRINQKLNDL